MSNEQQGRDAAARFREKFSLGTRPLTNVARLIEQTMGIDVACVDVDSDASGHGMTMVKNGRYVIAAGCTAHPMRLRSSLAHELGHVFLQSVTRKLSSGGWEERSPEEIQADVFARHLLLPLGAVQEMVWGRAVTLKVVSDLVQIYRVSPGVAAIQLREIGVMSREKYEDFTAMAMTSGKLAEQFGWWPEYQGLVAESRTPRAPQRLLARAIEGYRAGLVPASLIARLSGNPDWREVENSLTAAGIIPFDMDIVAQRPAPPGESAARVSLGSQVHSN